jgi:exopolysaccharide biosynthesis WecB/TagA/CpsF family protein
MASPDLDAVTITETSQTALLQDLRLRLRDETGFTVATLNLDHVVKLHRDPVFRAAYAAHTHVTADGRPVVWLSRLAGHKVDLVTGSDLIDPLAALAAELHSPIALLGSTNDVLAIAAERLEARNPGLNVVARIAPPMGFDPQGPAIETVIRDLANSGAKLCLLALGAPKQEILAALAAQALPGIGFVSVGAGLDFIAGAQRRAPKVLRIMAVEWLWRLSRDPSRMSSRYAACLSILPKLTGRAVTHRFKHRSGRV